MYSPAVIDQFPGLDLRSDPGEQPGAIDMLNVTLRPGRVRVRDGSSLLFTTANAPIAAFAFHLPAPHLIVATIGVGNVYALTTAGVSVASTTLPAAGTTYRASGVAIGTPSASYFYVTAGEGAGANTIRRWDGTTWTSPAGMPANERVLTLSPTDNRLMVCASNRVHFSNPGVPETFGANNYVDLTPGDGEQINAAAVFNNQTFVFKRTKFFVFYGNSENPAAPGTPLFNYRTVVSGIGPGPSPQSVCVGADGVYFVASDGIYRTTGGQPVKISTPLDPFFEGTTSTFWQGGTRAAGDTPGARLTWLDNVLYAFLPTSGLGTGVMMVYDATLNAWSCHARNAWALASFPATDAFGSPLRLIVGNNATSVLRSDPTLTTDAGTAIVSRYRSPFMTLGSPREKHLREAILDGTGIATLQWSADWGALDAGGSVTLSTDSSVASNRRRYGIRGRRLSWQIGASSGTWALNRLQANVLPELRGPGVT